MREHGTPPGDLAPPSTPRCPRSPHEPSAHTDGVSSSSSSLPSLRPHLRTCQGWQERELDLAAPARASTQSSEGGTSACARSDVDDSPLSPSSSSSTCEVRDPRRSTSPSTVTQFGGREGDVYGGDAAVVESKTAGDSQPDSDVQALREQPPRASGPHLPPPVLTFDRRASADLSQPTGAPTPAPATPAREEADEPAASADHAGGEEPPRVQVAPMFLTRWLAFFGRGSHGTPARRRLVRMVVTLASGAIQLVVIVTVLVLGVPRESPTRPGLNEWQACSQPLGVWNVVWLLRAMIACVLSVWTYKLKSRSACRQSPSDAEAAAASTRESGALPRPLAHLLPTRQRIRRRRAGLWTQPDLVRG